MSKKLQVTKTAVKKALANKAFDPNEGIFKIIQDAGNLEYFETRTFEELQELKAVRMTMNIDHEPGCAYDAKVAEYKRRLTKIIQMFVLAELQLGE